MTENEHIMDNGGSEQPPKSIPPEGKTPSAPDLPPEMAALLGLGAPPPASGEATETSATGVPLPREGTDLTTEQAATDEPESIALKLINEKSETLPEEVRSQFEESIKKTIDVMSVKESTADQIVGALKKSPFPPGPENDDLIKQMLIDSGHSAKTEEIMSRKTEWEKTEADLVDEPELSPEEEATLPKAKEDSKQILDEMKTDTARAREIENIPDEQLTQGHVDELKEIEEKQRGKIASWFDENPGKLHQANRLLIRPGIAAALLLMIMYMSALNVITSGAAKRVAK